MKDQKSSPQFLQVICARGKARKHLLEWPKLHLLKVTQAPIHDPDAIAIFGAGDFFENIFTAELACSCVERFEDYQEGSCLKELAIYLAERGTHGSSSFGI